MRIGIIGAGRISGAHASAAAALPETEIAAFSDIERERAEAAAARWGGRAFGDYRELLEDPAVDAVVIGLPHWLHRDATIDSLRAGKHVLLEKPMAMSVEECDAMIAAAGESRRTLMVGHSQHFFPVNIAARRLLEEGGIGTVVAATDTWYKPFWDTGQRPPWFLDAAKGGGMWPMNGSHMIDRMLFFLGSRVTAVKARIGSPIFGLSATDLGLAFLDFECGVSALLAHAGYREGVNRFEAELTGTQGQLRIAGQRLWVGRGNAWEEAPAAVLDLPAKPGAEHRSPTFSAQLHEFVTAIREERPPSVTAAHARHVVEVMCACEESSRTGREVLLG